MVTGSGRLGRGGEMRTAATAGAATTTTTKALGDAAEARALAWLERRGLALVRRNYRVARGPGARAGEVDLILRQRDGTLVFVEVRARRSSSAQGGAAASITRTKQRRVVLAAQHFLLGLAAPPPCRFDVLAIDGEHIEWLQAAFDAE